MSKNAIALAAPDLIARDQFWLVLVLPLWELWQPWAKKGFHAAAAVMAAKGKPLDELRDP